MNSVFYKTRFFIISGFSLVLSAFCGATEDINIELLKKTWEINGGGSRGRPYYSLDIGDLHLEGERSWAARWPLIQKATSYEGKKILELGCNFSLASTYLLKYEKALSAVGVDLPDAILKKKGTPRIAEGARLTQKSFGVNGTILQMDFNSSDYESILGNDYDVVFCMSILKWIDDKDRFLDYLANFNHIIYEGHDPDYIEIERFQSRGFHYDILGATQVGVSYPSDFTRTLIHFFKR